MIDFKEPAGSRFESLANAMLNPESNFDLIIYII